MSGAPGVCRCSAYLRPFVRHAAATDARTHENPGQTATRMTPAKIPFYEIEKRLVTGIPRPAARARAPAVARGAGGGATNERKIYIVFRLASLFAKFMFLPSPNLFAFSLRSLSLFARTAQRAGDASKQSRFKGEAM